MIARDGRVTNEGRSKGIILQKWSSEDEGRDKDCGNGRGTK